MDRGRELWALFLDTHVPLTSSTLPTEMIFGERLGEMLWSFFPLFRERRAVLSRTPVSRSFDDEADAALLALATDGTTHRWASMSAGAWKLLECRLSFAVVATLLEAEVGTSFSIMVPSACSQEHQATAALLYVLGTPARSIPPQWLAQYDLEGIEAFLPEQPSWLQ